MRAQSNIRIIEYYETWPYSHCQLRITDSLQVTYSAASSDVENARSDSGNSDITKAQFDAVCDLIERNKFFALQSNYSGAMDKWPHVSITVKTPDASASVNCTGWMPDQFKQIRERILELWGKPIIREGE